MRRRKSSWVETALPLETVRCFPFSGWVGFTFALGFIRIASFRSTYPDARIELDVQDVHEEVGGQHCQCDH